MIDVGRQSFPRERREQALLTSPKRMWYHAPMSQKKTMYLIKTKYGAFKAAIWRDRLDKIYLVEVPSFNRTMTHGSTLADAKYMAKDLIELLCEVAFDDGKIVIDDNGRIAGRGKLAKLIGPVTVRT